MNDPSQRQEVQTLPFQLFERITDLLSEVKSLRLQMQTLSETLAAHIRQNIDANQKISEYIGDQLQYRMWRETNEEQNLNLRLKQKDLELAYMQKQIESLESENEEADRRTLEFEKAKLEADNLKGQLELLRQNKSTTQDKLKSVGVKTFEQRAREAVIMTALGTLTASGVAGAIALLAWLTRQYMLSHP